MELNARISVDTFEYSLVFAILLPVFFSLTVSLTVILREFWAEINGIYVIFFRGFGKQGFQCQGMLFDTFTSFCMYSSMAAVKPFGVYLSLFA